MIDHAFVKQIRHLNRSLADRKCNSKSTLTFGHYSIKLNMNIHHTNWDYHALQSTRMIAENIHKNIVIKIHFWVYEIHFKLQRAICWHFVVETSLKWWRHTFVHAIERGPCAKCIDITLLIIYLKSFEVNFRSSFLRNETCIYNMHMYVYKRLHLQHVLGVNINWTLCKLESIKIDNLC